MLRKAVDIARTTIDTPSAKKVKQEPSVGGSLRFGGAKNLPPVEQAAAEAADAATEAADFQFDPVQVEIERFAYLSPESLQPFMTTDGMLNHFKMHWQLRDRFPLHQVVFKQVSAHIPHEANVEQVFSLAVSERAC